MKSTLITICWNSVKRIERCVASVLAQELPPTEYIFVDGGSTDGTLELLENLSSRLESKGITTRIIHQVRRDGEAGIPSAWNQGIEAAHGDVIALLNSDDFYHPDTLSTAVHALEAQPDAEMFAAAIDLEDADGKKVGELHPRCLCLAEFLMPLAHPACFITRRLYDRIGLYDTSYRISADYDFVWRCRLANARLIYSQECLVTMETGGLANSNRAAARNETLRIARKHSRFPILPYLAWLARNITGR